MSGQSSSLGLQLTATPSEPDRVFRRGPSKIVFQLVKDDTYEFTRWKDGRHQPVGLAINQIAHTEGDADIEQDSGMLEYGVYEQLDADSITAGWWVIDWFSCNYIKGVWGITDDDVEYEASPPRRALWSDVIQLGLVKPPLHVRAQLWLGFDFFCNSEG